MLPARKDPLIKTLMILFILAVVAFFAMLAADSPQEARAERNYWSAPGSTWLQ